MGMNTTNPRRIPVCPKCEYDQRGEVATWTEQCPMRGRCSECGYEFPWSEVYGILGEWGSELDWYAEHSAGWAGLVRRTPRTLLRLMFPIWFFKGVNHRRAIRLGMLMRWMIVVSLLMHLVVSVAGVPANRNSWGWSNGGYNADWQMNFVDTLCNTSNAVTFPVIAIVQHTDGQLSLRTPYEDGGWVEFMMISWVIVGVTLCWTVLMGAVFMLRWRGDYDRRHELGLFGRVMILSLLPVMVYIQIIRLGIAISAAVGMSFILNWIAIAYVVLLLVLIFWQQVLWTHAVRTIWEIKRSWVINIGGCFGSFIGGLVFAGWILM